MLIIAINNIRKKKISMKKELAYFNIEGEYGGNQNWFYDPMMRLGGCAAIATCDLCIYLKINIWNKHLYPFNKDTLQKNEYIKY